MTMRSYELLFGLLFLLMTSGIAMAQSTEEGNEQAKMVKRLGETAKMMDMVNIKINL